MTHRTARTLAAGSLMWGWIVVGGCSPTPGRGDPESRPADTPAAGGQPAASRGAGEWRSLFDGTTTAGWRGYRKTAVPAGWTVEDGTLTRSGEGGDLVTTDQFENFELELEWKVAPGGNSGIMYRVTEEAENTYETGPEMQVLDDARHGDGRSPLTSAGALYGLYPARPGVVKPANEWNQARLVVNGNHVEHWLNGEQIVSAEMWSPDWESRLKQSKFVEWPGYARAPRGHIALQDHGDRVWFRNIRIRALP